MKLEGSTALVTGASLGIGRAAAIALAENGADVAINYRSHDEAAREVADCIESLGRRALLCKADVSDQQAVEEMVERAARELGGLNILVSNAVYSDRELFYKADMAGFRRTIDVSMWGAFYVLRAGANVMIRNIGARTHPSTENIGGGTGPRLNQTGGSIIVVSSAHAHVPIPTSMAYNMAKAAIDQMARTAAIELIEHRIRVNVVHPGWIDTPGERKFFSEETLKKAGETLPWGRMGRPEEIATGIVYLASDDADYVTGSTLTIDGGVQLPWWSKRGSGDL